MSETEATPTEPTSEDSTDSTPDPVVELDVAPESAPRRREPRVEECADLPLAGRVEAVLLSTDRPLSDARLLDILGIENERKSEVVAAIDDLNRAYDETRRAMRIERVASGWQILTRPEYGPLLARTQRDRQNTRLSQAALETLAIIAYRQPVLRAEIEAIRGVSCGEVLRSLLERRMIKITGRAEELGRPMLYGTTREFLKVFGLASKDDLPEVD